MTSPSGSLVECAGGDGRLSLVSPRLLELGIAHGFTTRRGGLDVATAEDLAGPLADAGLDPGPVFIGRQVHGGRVSGPADRAVPADAHLARSGEGVVAVRTADCLGVLLAADGAVVAAHAGWRGVLADVLPAAIGALGGGAAVRAAALGPCIGAGAFEVGPEVAAAYAERGFRRCLVASGPGRFLLDLAGAVRIQLQRGGVTEERIDGTDRCTFAEPTTFYSYRRDGPGRGHQAAWILAAGDEGAASPRQLIQAPARVQAGAVWGKPGR